MWQPVTEFLFYFVFFLIAPCDERCRNVEALLSAQIHLLFCILAPLHFHNFMLRRARGSLFTKRADEFQLFLSKFRQTSTFQHFGHGYIDNNYIWDLVYTFKTWFIFFVFDHTILWLSCLILKSGKQDFKASHHCCAWTSIMITSLVYRPNLSVNCTQCLHLSCFDCDFHMWMKLEGHYCDLPETKPGQEGDTSTEGESNKLEYCVTDVPPWYLCILLGIQVARQTPFPIPQHTHTHAVCVSTSAGCCVTQRVYVLLHVLVLCRHLLHWIWWFASVYRHLAPKWAVCCLCLTH